MKTLGIDLGTNSLGWALIETPGEPGQKEEGRIVDLGVRIFSASEMAGRDPKTQESLARARRDARAMRRRRDRYLKRRARLLDLLTETGLMPEGEDARAQLLAETDDRRKGEGGLEQSVYALRARALDHALSPHELGRVLFQLNQRRGFKSNRKADSNEPELGKIADATNRLETQMLEDNARSFGEWLYFRRKAGLSVRARMDADGDAYDFYPSRAVLEREYDRIMEKQRLFHADLLPAAVIDEIRKVIFYQRPLVPVKPGKCAYTPSEQRLPKAHPLFQAFRLVKEVNELEYAGEDQIWRKLTRQERDELLLLLRTTLNKRGEASFTALRKTLKLGREFRFNKESDNRKALQGDVVYFRLSRPECFGNQWAGLSAARQAEIISRLRDEPDRARLIDWLRAECGLAKENAAAVADTALPEGYGRLGATALAALTDEMLAGQDDDGLVITEAEAARRVYGRTNSEGDPDRKAEQRLPKYQTILERHIPPGIGGEAEEEAPEWDLVMGRITNPTVHIALNQLRRVVNGIIDKHGRPDRIAIELGRELKLNDRKRADINRRIGENTREARELSTALTEVHRQRDNGYNRLRLRLWQELNPAQPLGRACIYCGTTINAEKLFNGETDIDHILPYSQTLDDSRANRLLCCAACNRLKGNRAPADVPQWREHYHDILARATVLPKNKQWRFAEDAMTRHGEEADFLARQVTDMQYMSRLALTYLSCLYDAEEPGIDGVFRRHSRIRALPGRMTEMLRRSWALNDILYDHNQIADNKPKNRMDHRHHAIDAAVIACTTRSLIQKIAGAAAGPERDGAERVVRDIVTPWPEFRDELREKVRDIVVSHKPDHGTISRAGYSQGRGQTAGQLHNETAYGFTGETDENGTPLVVRRIPVSHLKKPADIMALRTNEHGHSELRDRLYEATRGLEGKAFEEAIQNFVRNDGKFRGIRHVRIIEPRNPVWISHGGGKHKKGYLPGENYRFDIWELPDGRWDADVLSLFDAHRADYLPKMRAEHHNARKIMSLVKGDMVAYQGGDGERVIARVRQFDQRNKQLYLDEHFETNLTQREKDKAYSPLRVRPNPFKKLAPRQVRIDEIGTVYDPGPWWLKPEN